jgi:uncharacterized protein (TIGR02996 family)
MHPDERALRRAICERPDDDLARLAYADWLEEDGSHWRPRYAEFIRAQARLESLRLAKAPHSELIGKDILCRSMDCEVCHLRRRIDELAEEPYPPDGSEAVCHWAGDLLAVWRFAHDTFRRGFVWRVRCTMAQWRRHGAAVCGIHPVEEVDIFDKRPSVGTVSGSGWRWYDSMSDDPTIGADPDVLPETFFDLTHAGKPGDLIWETEAEALVAFRLAALNWARARNGLPPLEPAPPPAVPLPAEAQA